MQVRKGKTPPRQLTLNSSNIDTCAENGNALFSILATRFTTAETMPWIYWPELTWIWPMALLWNLEGKVVCEDPEPWFM